MGNKTSSTTIDMSKLPADLQGYASLDSFISVSFILSELKSRPGEESVQGAGIAILTKLLEDDDDDDDDTSQHTNVIAHSPGGVKLILAAMKRFPRNPDLQKNGCGILFRLAARGVRIEARGAVDSIVRALKLHLDNHVTVLRGCMALYYMAKDSPRYQAEIGKAAQCLKAITGVMRKYDLNRLLQDTALSTLYVAARHKLNWEALASADCVSAIMSATNKFPESDNIQNHCRGILCTVVWGLYPFYKRTMGMLTDPAIYARENDSTGRSDGIVHVVTHSGVVFPMMPHGDYAYDRGKGAGVVDIVHAMHKWNHKVEVILSSLIALFYMTESCDENQRVITTSNYGISLITASLRKHMKIAAIQIAGCLLLRTLFEPSGVEASALIETILAAMKYHQDNELVQVTGFATLAAFASVTTSQISEDNPDILSTLDNNREALEVAIAAMEQDFISRGIQEQALSFLIALLNDRDDDIMIRAADAGAARGVIAMMYRHFDDLDIQDLALAALNRLASVESNILTIIGLGGIGAVTSAMAENEERGNISSNITMGGCLVLRSISHNRFSGGAMLQEEGLCAIVSVLRNEQWSTEVLEVALYALWSVNCLSDIDCLVGIVGQGGIEAVIKVMHNNKRSLDIQIPAMFILFQAQLKIYASAPERIEQAQRENIEAIISIMRREAADEHIQGVCIGMLAHLLEKGHEIIISDSVSVKAVVNAMKCHDNNLMIQKRGCVVLRHLSHKKKNHNMIAVDGGVQAIVYAMTKHRQIREIQECGIDFFFSMRRNEVMQVLIVQSGGIPAAFFAWVNFRECEVIQENVFKMLSGFATMFFSRVLLWRFHHMLSDR